MTLTAIQSRMLSALRSQPMGAQAVAEAADISVTTAQHHLRRLFTAGTITRTAKPSDRPGQRRYVYQPSDGAPAETTRNQNLPFATITRFGTGSARAAGRFVTLLLDERRLGLVLAGDMRLYALDPDSERANAVCEHHPEWIVGTYTDCCDAGRVAMDIRLAARGMA